MKIDLLNLKDGKTEYFEKLDAATLDIEGLEFVLKDFLDAHTTAEKRGNKVKISIETSFILIMRCSRCLEDYEESFVTDDSYFVKPGRDEEAEKYLTDEDVYAIFAPIDEIDTVPLIRDSLILSVPMKPLCRKDCKGLCPVCGANLNTQSCHHNIGEGGSRWQKMLMDIKGKIEKG